MGAVAAPKMIGVSDPWRTMLVCSVIAVAMYRYKSHPGTHEGQSLSYDSSSDVFPQPDVHNDGIESGTSDTAGRWPGFDPQMHSQMPKRRLMEVQTKSAPPPPPPTVQQLIDEWQQHQNKNDKVDFKEHPAVLRDPTAPFSMGPNITDWDEQRELFKANHPNRNISAKGGPKIMLVTSTAPKNCPNEVGDHVLLRALKNKMDYCSRHDISLYFSMTLLDRELTSFWAKYPAIRRVMISHPEVEWIWWMDSDAIFTDMHFHPPMDKYDDFDIVMHGFEDMIYKKKNWIGINTGSMLMRNSQWNLDYLDDWTGWGLEGETREEGGKWLHQALPSRPLFECDDQSAMAALMYAEQNSFRQHVFLEQSYYLHGYWVILTNKYEEMMRKYHPGVGDHRWPLITHFVGCKPCGKLEQLDPEETQKCFHEMNRAFNFADNQILRPYGLEHVTLNSSQLHPINVTTKALKAARKSELYRLARAGAEKEGQAANEQVNHESTIGI